MATLFEIAAMNWHYRQLSERRRRQFRDRTIAEAIFWVQVCEMWGHRFTFRSYQ